jgi:hypothetical protein
MLTVPYLVAELDDWRFVQALGTARTLRGAVAVARIFGACGFRAGIVGPGVEPAESRR